MCEPFNKNIDNDCSNNSVLYKEDLIQPCSPVKRKRIYRRCMKKKMSSTKDETSDSLLQDKNIMCSKAVSELEEITCSITTALEEITRSITPEITHSITTSESPTEITADNSTISNIGSPNSKMEDTYLYLSQEMYNKLLSSNIDDDKDITFQCIETTTKEGFKVLVYNNSNKNTNLEIIEECNNNIDKFLFQVPPLELDSSSEMLEEEEESRCKVCGVAFTDTRGLQIHLALYHSNGSSTLLHCWVCERNCGTVADYLAHMRELHPEVIFKCPVCGDVTGSMNSLSTHINNAHFNTAKYICEHCNAKFRSPHTRQYHIKNKHLKVNNTIICDICMKVFQHERSLLRHMKRIHQGKREICTTCNQSYSSLSSLYVHQRSKHDKVSYRCGFCSLSFKSTSSVAKHEAEMHDVSRNFSQTPTERLYHYKHVTDENVIVKRRKRGESTGHITCNNCKIEFSCHDSYTKHCEKFHQGEYQM